MRALFLFLVCLVASTATSFATVREDVAYFTLDNGLEVVVIEDRRAPVVTHMLWYKVGAVDEAQGQSGIAHFLEHLMFKGTENLGAGEFSAIVAANGGTDNAFTSHDFTGYFQRVAADRLGQMMEMEADRMRGLTLTEEQIETERQVILQERANRIDNSPSGLFREQRTAALFLNHPYGRPVIGWEHEIKALTRDQILAFYKRYYAPNNAVLIVAGDVSPEEVRVLAEASYGPIPPSADLPPRILPAEPPHLSPRRMSYADARVTQPSVVRTYLGPSRVSGAQEEAAVVSMLSSVLGNGTTSYLVQRLVYDEEVALDAGAFYMPGTLGPGRFVVYIVPSPDVSLEDGEAALDAAIADFMTEGPDADELETIKARIRASEIYELDRQSGRAQSYGAALSAGLTIEDVQTWSDVLQGVTSDDILAAAEELFVLDRSVTGYMTGIEETSE